MSSVAELYVVVALLEISSWIYELAQRELQLSLAMGPSIFISPYWPPSKTWNIIGCLVRDSHLSWTCSCTVVWHYVKLSHTIRHLSYLDLSYFTCACCQPLLPNTEISPKHHLSCYGFRVLTSDFQFSVLAKCQVHEPYCKLLKIGGFNGSDDTALNIGMNNKEIIMQGQMSRKHTWLLNTEKSALISRLIHLRKSLWKRKG